MLRRRDLNLAEEEAVVKTETERGEVELVDKEIEDHSVDQEWAEELVGKEE